MSCLHNRKCVNSYQCVFQSKTSLAFLTLLGNDYVQCLRATKNSTTKAETICLYRQTKAVFFPSCWCTTKSEKSKYLGVSFTNDGRQNNELDIYIGKARAVMRQLHPSVLLKWELCTKAKLFIIRSVCSGPDLDLVRP